MPGLELIDLRAMMPTLFPAVYGLLLLVFVPLLKHDRRWLWYFAVGGMFISALVPAMLLVQWVAGLEFTETAAGVPGLPMLHLDQLALWLDIIFALAGLMAVLVVPAYFSKAKAYRPEVFPLLFLAVSGMTIMVTTENLVMIFVGLEVFSISLYVMCGLARERIASVESALKYFLLGAFSSAFFVYGIALVYGATGHMDLPGISAAVGGLEALVSLPMLLAGGAMILVTFAFKIGVVPLHFWVPDVYQGAPTPVTAFMAAGTKAAAFGILLRILHSGFGSSAEVSERWFGALALLAVLTMLLGNLLALVQDRVKRLLAYSSIAHAGYLILGLIAPLEIGAKNVLFYLLAYTFMTVGAFVVISLFQTEDGEDADHLSQLAGLWKRRPLLSLALGVFMFSLIGIPPMGGFTGKYMIFMAAIESGHIVLAAIMGVAALIGAAYYLKVIVAVFFRDSEREMVNQLEVPGAAVIALTIAVLGTLILGLAPSLVLAPLSQVGTALLP